MQHTDLIAVGGRDADRARCYADNIEAPASFGSYDELLPHDGIDAVYVPLPVSMHTDWTIKALEVGKHVLCQKTFAVTAAKAARCFDAAEDAGKLCVEGLRVMASAPLLGGELPGMVGQELADLIRPGLPPHRRASLPSRHAQE
ncbi:Gfo/Idh/MocA family protein [Streptomyces sp. NPDC000888]